VAEVTIDGKPVSLSSNGNFNFSTYVPPKGKELKVEVTDIAGLTTSKIIKLKANRMISDSSISFESLNPLNKRVKKNEDALALIVGVSNYENTKAKALYADNDAMVFKDYATEKLGISKNRIKILLNDGADERDILLSVQEWLRRSAKPNKSDIYVFFAGHGLASQDGKNMYLLPHDGSPRLLEKTAILRNELFFDIKEANPKSVTVFLDTCYSGETRNEEILVAGRPVAIIAKEQAIPDGFTLFSAASNEQISRPLEEAKHGMFSYFLMKGMEGDADTNNDKKITARELHIYVKQNVVQQSSGSQTPELQGDKDRVIVNFN
jgi:antitoxin component of RelBE/YafQ-DinJ toxin-antitoxin module